MTATAAPTSGKPAVTPVAATAAPTPVKPAVTPIAAIAASGKNPFKPQTTELKTPVTPAITTAPPKAPVVLITPKPLRQWEVKSGMMLRAAFTSIAEKEMCADRKWRVEWQATDVDYPVDATLRFTGEFDEFYFKLFKLYENAEIPLFVKKYPNCVLEIVR
ncbi:TcpQ domain-containing protein [Pectobacterium carotovorum]|uniref:TcpQ domain-containing protein n=1 Tax=Pectobacterium carotovorum TaxID=554 RepID=UPI003D154B9E